MGHSPSNEFGPFITTPWSGIGRIAAAQGEDARGELGRLLARYLPALRAHLVLEMKLPLDRANDLLQGFVAEKILENDLIARADREKGKFRTFLLRALRNHVVSVARRENAKKRSPGSLASLDGDESTLQPGTVQDPSAAFDVAWAREVLVGAVALLKTECERSKRPDLWGVFESRLLRPVLDGEDPEPYDRLVERFGFASPAQASNALITAKRMFGRVLASVVGEYARDDIEAEIADLRKILSGAAAGS